MASRFSDTDIGSEDSSPDLESGIASEIWPFKKDVKFCCDLDEPVDPLVTLDPLGDLFTLE